jgi:hypothetical protein
VGRPRQSPFQPTEWINGNHQSSFSNPVGFILTAVGADCTLSISHPSAAAQLLQHQWTPWNSRRNSSTPSTAFHHGRCGRHTKMAAMVYSAEDTKIPSLMTACITMTVCICIVVPTRFFVRGVMVGKLGADDWCIGVATVHCPRRKIYEKHIDENERS